MKFVNIKLLPVIATIGLILSGCNQFQNHLAELTIEMSKDMKLILSPGYKINISGNIVPIAGFDECPKQPPTMAKFFGSSSNDGSLSCIVMDNKRASVKVMLALPSGAITENWLVIRKSGKTNSGRPYSYIGLQRPDGSMVVSADTRS